MAKIIDAHIHYGDDAPQLLTLLDELDVMLLNISLVADPAVNWRAQAEFYAGLHFRYPQHFAWCTTFDLPDFDDPKYADRVIAGLERDFANGAVACKVWKNVGMEVRKPDGSFLMIDDPIFTPIFDRIAERDSTLLLHMAEPLACWLPLDEKSPHYRYYSTHPEWHMFKRPDFPSHVELIAARDRLVAAYPNLRVVAAHLASLEHDVDEVAARLDRYPNLAVDISARLGDLAVQDSGKVRDFFLSYQDRILFGTDVVMRERPSTMPDEKCQAAIADLAGTYRIHFAYLETGETLSVRGIETQGLSLPEPVLQKIYRTNAERWYPGLATI
jgi:predicted TIM-barrel fold metal-dependent hydrolase